MATIAIGCAVTRKAADRRSTSLIPHSTFLVFFLFLISFVFTASRVATAQWWIHFFLLTVFAWTLIRARVSSRTVATWFVISLLPHAFLGIWQYASQEIVAMTWFGIAAQDPSVAGVSVVEAGPMRVLRAYGGFPHPNIFGGWLAMGYWRLSSRVRHVQKRGCVLLRMRHSRWRCFSFKRRMDRGGCRNWIWLMIFFVRRPSSPPS